MGQQLDHDSLPDFYHLIDNERWKPRKDVSRNDVCDSHKLAFAHGSVPFSKGDNRYWTKQLASIQREPI